MQKHPGKSLLLQCFYLVEITVFVIAGDGMLGV